MSKIGVVIGDVHGELKLAYNALCQLEVQQGEIAQVFSVGDLSLFFDPMSWDYLTGPKNHRHPEKSEEIKEAWNLWKWPLSIIGGNHEDYISLRRKKLTHQRVSVDYVDSGVLLNNLDNFICYGISGIFHPKHLEFLNMGDPKNINAQNWVDFAGLVEKRVINPKRITYFKNSDLDKLKQLPQKPNLLLTHDWPVAPPSITQIYLERPESELNEILSPQFHCCGHHHRMSAFDYNKSQVRALNIISRDGLTILPGWAWVFEWTSKFEIKEIGFWPAKISI